MTTGSSGARDGEKGLLLNDNRFHSKGDLESAVITLFEPVRQCFSTGAARVRLGHTAGTYPQHIAELESFCRPLWGLVPLAAGEAIFRIGPFISRGLQTEAIRDTRSIGESSKTMSTLSLKWQR